MFIDMQRSHDGSALLARALFVATEKGFIVDKRHPLVHHQMATRLEGHAGRPRAPSRQAWARPMGIQVISCMR